MIAHARFAGPKDVDEATVAEWLGLFVAPGQVTELRALEVSSPGWRQPHTVSGFFDGEHLPEMASAALELSPHSRGVYFVPNPVDEALLAMRCNRVDGVGKDDTTQDRHITARRWLLVDADPVRPAKVSATDGEKAAAHAVARSVWAWGRSEGMPEPVVADSGNGYHLLYPLDLPTDDGGFVQRLLTTLAGRFDTPAVSIDRAVFNPARIVKLYGTLARKGDHVPTWRGRPFRPHRTSRVLHVPAEQEAAA